VSKPFHVDDLIGKAVVGPDGREIGHIFEMVAERRGEELVIVEYHLGSGAALERMSASVRGLFGLAPREPTRISWDTMDLSDPSKPVCLIPPGPGRPIGDSA
jgi:hypothetical protein